MKEVLHLHYIIEGVFLCETTPTFLGLHTGYHQNSWFTNSGDKSVPPGA